MTLYLTTPTTLADIVPHASIACGDCTGVHKDDHCMTMVCSRNGHDEHVFTARTCCVHAGKIVKSN